MYGLLPASHIKFMERSMTRHEGPGGVGGGRAGGEVTEAPHGGSFTVASQLAGRSYSKVLAST